MTCSNGSTLVVPVPVASEVEPPDDSVLVSPVESVVDDAVVSGDVVELPVDVDVGIVEVIDVAVGSVDVVGSVPPVIVDDDELPQSSPEQSDSGTTTHPCTMAAPTSATAH